MAAQHPQGETSAASASVVLIGLVLLAAGHAAMLASTVAGPAVAFQHLAPFATPPRAVPSWVLATIGAEWLAIALSVRHWWPVARRAVRALGRIPTLLTLAGAAVGSAALSRAPTTLAAEIGLATASHLAHAALLLAILVSLSTGARTRLTAWLVRALEHRATVPLAALGSLAGSVLLAVTVYERHPHVPDEVAYLFQARYLAAGHWWLTPPPVPEAFDVPFMLVEQGKWFSTMPSGWAFLLAAGERLHVGWLVNPLLGGANVWLIARLARALGQPPRTGALAAVLLAASPWHLFLAMSLMSHTLALTLTLIATLAVLRAVANRAAHQSTTVRVMRDLVPAGIGIGLVGVNRPLEGVGVALVLGCTLLLVPAADMWMAQTADARSAPRRWTAALRSASWRDTTLLAVITGLVAASVLPYNRALMGDSRQFPVMRYMDLTYGPGRNALGFGPTRGLGWEGLDPLPGHGPLDVLINAWLNLFQLDTEFTGWPVGVLALVVAWLGSRGRSTLDRTLLLACAAVVAVHSLYWFSGGPDFGARYWFLGIAPLTLLVARALIDERTQAWLLPGAAIATTLALLVFVPWRALDKYRGYRGMTAAARPLLADTTLRGSVLLVRGRTHPDVAASVVYNAVDGDSLQPLFAWDRDAKVRQRVAAAYPARRFFVVDGPSLTGGAYRVVAGPYTAEAVQRGQVSDAARASSDHLLFALPP